jgi:hypothetical protein
VIVWARMRSLPQKGHYYRERLTSVFYPPHESQSEIFGPDGGRIFNVEMNARAYSLP